MSNEFLTKGLQHDRYMKARQLAKQFENEIEAELRTMGEEMIEQNPECFDTGITDSVSISTKSNSLPFARIDYPMARVQSQNNQTTLTLNVHLYWCDPTDYNRIDIDGALRALGYKIKNVATDDEQKVARQTRDWPIQVAENRFGGENAFYEHVSSAEDIEETGERLVEHFSAFVDEYGVPQKN